MSGPATSDARLVTEQGTACEPGIAAHDVAVQDGSEVFWGDVVRELKESCTGVARVLYQILVTVSASSGEKQYKTRAQSGPVNSAWLCGGQMPLKQTEQQLALLEQAASVSWYMAAMAITEFQRCEGAELQPNHKGPDRDKLISFTGAMMMAGTQKSGEENVILIPPY